MDLRRKHNNLRYMCNVYHNSNEEENHSGTPTDSKIPLGRLDRTPWSDRETNPTVKSYKTFGGHTAGLFQVGNITNTPGFTSILFLWSDVPKLTSRSSLIEAMIPSHQIYVLSISIFHDIMNCVAVPFLCPVLEFEEISTRMLHIGVGHCLVNHLWSNDRIRSHVSFAHQILTKRVHAML